MARMPTQLALPREHLRIERHQIAAVQRLQRIRTSEQVLEQAHEEGHQQQEACRETYLD